jgi:hypothetical protein
VSATVSIDLTETIVFTALRGLLATMPALGAIAIVKGQDNRVPEPSGSDYIVMWPLLRVRLGTNVDTYFADDDSPLPDVKLDLQPTRFDVQIDVHGPSSGDNVQTISTLFRDEFSTSYFDAGTAAIQALYASDPRQLQFVNAEAQSENRWSVDLSLQINPVVTVPQRFAEVVTPTTTNVQGVYPP